MKPSESEASWMYSSASYSNIVRSILYLSFKAETIFFESWEKSRLLNSPSLSPALVECFLVRRPLSRPESLCYNDRSLEFWNKTWTGWALARTPERLVINFFAVNYSNTSLIQKKLSIPFESLHFNNDVKIEMARRTQHEDGLPVLVIFVQGGLDEILDKLDKWRLLLLKERVAGELLLVLGAVAGHDVVTVHGVVVAAPVLHVPKIIPVTRIIISVSQKDFKILS